MKSRKWRAALVNAVAGIVILVAVTAGYDLEPEQAAELAGYVVIAIGWATGKHIEGVATEDAAKKGNGNHG